jgi:GH25 family lysozyme M1 (1,4-beta-N-acetylmuramidase)
VLTPSRRATVVLAALVSGSLVGLPPASAARAANGETGLHQAMMPMGSPDRVRNTHPVAATRPHAGSATSPALGPDVASYQHPNGAAIQWDQVAANGQTFALVKATELYTDSGGQPQLYRNPYLQSDLSGAEGAGLVVGSYAFAHPENDPLAQADAFSQAIGSLPPGSLPPVLDLETSGGLSVPRLIAWAHAFLDRLATDTGVTPMIYTGPSFWNDSLGGTTDFSSYPLWQATYTDAATPPTFGGWGTYTDAASVAGISGGVDQSRFRGSRSDLSAVAQPNVPASLSAPASLGAYQSLRSASRQYKLIMQGDGNLVLSGMGHTLWSSATNGHPGSHLSVTSDAQAVVYSPSGEALWSSGNTQGTGAVLTLQDNGDLVLRGSAGVLWHNGAPGSNLLATGGSLLARQYLHSTAGQHGLVMQPDGNLVLRLRGAVRWNSITSGNPGARAVLQADGNLVVYDAGGRPRWSSGTSGTGPHNRLVLQDDGNLVLYGVHRAVWNTRTHL